VTALYIDPMTASIFQGAIRGLTFSASINVAITLYTTDTANPTYNPVTATSVYTETATSLDAFQATVTRDEGTEVRVGDVWFAINPASASPTVGDRISVSGVDWYIFKVGDPDPTDSLIRLYTRRSPS
jgi:hypothetical protein